jgi:hypothetical protein
MADMRSYKVTDGVHLYFSKRESYFGGDEFTTDKDMTFWLKAGFLTEMNPKPVKTDKDEDPPVTSAEMRMPESLLDRG